MKILVVGGGTAGLITSIILKKHLDITVDLVFSSDIGIVGVGEGSTEHFSQFMKFTGIKDQEIIKQCDATYKSGIVFDNWGVKKYMHSVAEPFSKTSGEYSPIYGQEISKDSRYLYRSMTLNNRINKWLLNNEGETPANQYHFNTHKLNEFLKTKAKQFGMRIFDDKINEILFYENGNIKSVVGEKEIYKYDFYVDSTGFKKLLIGKMGAKWNSVSKYLPMNSAITFSTPDEEEYDMWTLAKGMDSGWMFRLPVWGRYGNGYIFDSNFISFEKAKKEILDSVKGDLSFGKDFSFDAGHLDRPWIKNCVAVGLSSSFIEPLEATSIGSTIQQAFLLMHKLANYSEKDIKKYNDSFNDIMQNVVDFVFLHYMSGRKDTDFWKYMYKKNPPQTLSDNLEIWKNRLPVAEDFSRLSNYIMFTEANFIVLMNGLNMFNKKNIKKEFLMQNKQTREISRLIIEEQRYFENNVKTFGHKEMLRMIREEARYEK